MTIKTSISLTDQMHEKAMQLVQAGAYPHLSALVQQAMRDLLSAEAAREARLALLRAELQRRMDATEFIPAEEVFPETEAEFAALLAEGDRSDKFAVE